MTQYYKLEFERREQPDGTEDIWLEFHTGSDENEVYRMEILNRALLIKTDTKPELLPTPYRVAEWIMDIEMEVSVYKLQRVS